MRKIKKLKMKQERFTGKREYTLYTYEVVDELGNIELIDDLNQYEPGTRVECWFDSQYNKVKMREYKPTRQDKR